MNADHYRNEEGDLVLDFTGRRAAEWAARSSFGASHRQTTSSRAPGAIRRGTVWSKLTTAVECADCHRMADGALVQGRHSPRPVGGRILNCVQKEITPWP